MGRINWPRNAAFLLSGLRPSPSPTILYPLLPATHAAQLFQKRAFSSFPGQWAKESFPPENCVWRLRHQFHLALAWAWMCVKVGLPLLGIQAWTWSREHRNQAAEREKERGGEEEWGGMGTEGAGQGRARRGKANGRDEEQRKSLL